MWTGLDNLSSSLEKRRKTKWELVQGVKLRVVAMMMGTVIRIDESLGEKGGGQG